MLIKSNMATLQGLFRPKYPKKYNGNPTRIIYRSSWELKFMKWLDLNVNIISWSSEELWISYRSPLDGKLRRYFPDFLIKMQDKTGKISTKMIEIKPKHQTIEPTPKTRGAKPTKKYINEVTLYGINSSKWRSAADYCADRNWEFLILTEKELGIK